MLKKVISWYLNFESGLISFWAIHNIWEIYSYYFNWFCWGMLYSLLFLFYQLVAYFQICRLHYWTYSQCTFIQGNIFLVFYLDAIFEPRRKRFATRKIIFFLQMRILWIRLKSTRPRSWTCDKESCCIFSAVASHSSPSTSVYHWVSEFLAGGFSTDRSFCGPYAPVTFVDEHPFWIYEPVSSVLRSCW